MTKQPIGIFDSGVGGLTVYKEIRNQFPHEDLIYFGDTARVPYGPKSKNTIIQYSIQNARFLLQKNVKLVIIACNTASAVALETLKKILPVPVIGVIVPGSKAAVKASKNNKIGVIGTDGTIHSQSYPQTIQKYNKEIDTFSKSCPLFVSLAEEGWENHEVTFLISKEYLSGILEKGIDTIVLGCTHYPILKNTLQKIVGSKITLVDSAIETSRHLKEELLIKEESGIGKDLFYVSDNEEKFIKIAKKILNKDNINIQKVELGESWFVKNL